MSGQSTFQTLVQRLLGPSAALAWKIILLLLVVTISYLALSPAPPRTIDLGWDKLNHAFAFTALAFAAALGYAPWHGKRSLIYLTLLAYGGLIEMLQLFVPGRSAEWTDLLADGIGIACGALIAAAGLRMLATGRLR